MSLIKGPRNYIDLLLAEKLANSEENLMNIMVSNHSGNLLLKVVTKQTVVQCCNADVNES